MRQKFYPNKWGVLPVLIFPVLTIIIFFCLVPFSEIRDNYIYVIIIFIVEIVVLSPFVIKATASVEIAGGFIIYKHNYLKKACKLNIEDIVSVFIEYRRAKTIEITAIDGSVIRFDCIYQGLVVLCGCIPEIKISVFYISREFIPRKHSDFLLKLKILK